MAYPKLSEQDLVDRILDHLRKRVLHGDPLRELTDTTPLLEYRLLNSIRTAELLVFIKDDLGIDIDGLELTGATMATIRDLVLALTELSSP